MAANGMDIAPSPELGTGYVCAFDTEAAAVAACQDGDTVAAVRGKARAEPPAAPLVKVPLGSQETWEEFRAAACTATQAELQAWGSRPGGLSEAWRKSRAKAAAEKGEGE